MKRLLVLPYETPFGYYVYETQRNEIVSVSKELFDYVVQRVKGCTGLPAPSSKMARKQWNELRDAGYLSESRIEVIRHPWVNGIEDWLDRKLGMLTLQVTQRCNLRCSYCIYSEGSLQNRSHRNASMSFDTAKRVIDFYHEHSIDNEEISISFYGGEPLLEFELIRRVVAYADEIFDGKKILYRMTTNATLLTPEVSEFLFNSGHDFDLLVSFDGAKTVHDASRCFPSGRGSYDTVVRNLTWTVEHYPDSIKKIRFNSVINPANDYDSVANPVVPSELNGIDAQYNIVEVNGMPAEYTPEYRERMQYDTFLGYLAYLRDAPQEYPNLLTKYSIEQDVGHARQLNAHILGSQAAPGGPCRPGARFFADIQGNFFPCERVDERAACMGLGDLEQGFNISNAIAMLQIGELTEEACKECWAFSLCSICVKKCGDGNKLCARSKIKHCRLTRGLALEQIDAYILMAEHEQHERKLQKIMMERGGDENA